MGSEHRAKQIVLFDGELGTGDTLINQIDLGKIRIKAVKAVSEEAQAAHATILRRVLVGTVADTDRYVEITNDSDVSSSALDDPDGGVSSAAWVANVAREVDFSLKTAGNAPNAAAPGTPGGSYPEHSGTLLTTVIHSGTTPTASRVTVTMDYFESD